MSYINISRGNIFSKEHKSFKTNNYSSPWSAQQQATIQMLKTEVKWQFLPKYDPTSGLCIEENAWWCSSKCRLCSKSHKPSSGLWFQDKKHETLKKNLTGMQQDKIINRKVISLFVSQRSNNCSKEHGRPKTSNEKLSDLPFPISICTIKVVHIWTL